jgi:hypothetical protein
VSKVKIIEIGAVLVLPTFTFPKFPPDGVSLKSRFLGESAEWTLPLPSAATP